MTRSMRALLLGTFVLRTATGTTGALLVFWTAHLRERGTIQVSTADVAAISLAFYLTELLGSPIFGVLADQIGRKPVMLLGPLFGLVAVLITPFALTIPLLIATRLLEGSSTAASVPSDRKSTRLNSSHSQQSRMPSSA